MTATILSANLPPAKFDTLPLPQRGGAGLKSRHVDAILESGCDIGFFEVHAENYMGAGGLPHAQLTAIRQNYPLSLHGVGMSIGGADKIDMDHLKRFKAVMDRYQPSMVSEHLAWSTHDDVFYNDLLPVPYTDQTLESVINHVDQVQTFLGRQILIENPSTYVTFQQSTWIEFDFMGEIARRSGCGLLFDVNNVFVSATNHNYSPQDYINAYPLHLVQQIHLAGYATDSDDDGETLLIDAHDRPVSENVWDLYQLTLSRTGPLPSLIEWDNNVPEWEILAEEVYRADVLLRSFSDEKKTLRAIR